MILAVYDKQIIFEGNDNNITAIYPGPYLMHLRKENFADKKDPPIIFREDSFNPTIRIKRGRFYEKKEVKLRINALNFGPYITENLKQILSLSNKQKNIIDNFVTYTHLSTPNINLHLNSRIFLGDQEYGDQKDCSVWRIVDAERLYNGETPFTLKSLSALGTLPELIEEKLPEERKKEIRDGFQKVVDVAPIQIAESVVDVCREFARLLLAAWLPTVGVADATGDLGGLVSKVPEDRKGIANAASVINRLHPRGKSSERERGAGRGQEIRPLADEDASLAVSLIGFLLRDFGWAA